MERIFQGISLKPLSEAGEADEAGHTSRQSFKEDKKSEDISLVSSASYASKSVDKDRSFSQQCFDCRRILTEDTPRTFYEGKPMCFPCFDKIETLKRGL